MPRTAHLIIQHEAWNWRLTAAVRRALGAVCDAEGLREAELSILCVGDAHIRMLNHNFRGKDEPTNVLAFPSGEAGYLGDIALSVDTLSCEAAAQGKTLEHHLTHLIVHSVLHLLGHDHMKAAEAKAMEAKEIKILHTLGIANPYEVILCEP